MPSALAPIRVVRFVTRLNIGGPSIQVVELASRLSARGFETLLIHGEVGPQEGDMSYLLECAASPPRTKQLAALKRPISPASDARAAWKVYRLLCEFKPAIVHTHMAKAGAVGRLAALAYNNTAGRRARARLVHTYHGHVLEGYFGLAKTRLFIAAERRLAGVTDRIVAVSQRIRDELVQEYRIGRHEQYRVVPLGFDLDALAAIEDEARAVARAALDIPPGATVVTTVGRLTAIKEQRLFLEVAQRVARLHASTVFLIVGDGELREALEAAAVSLGIADRVRFLGWRRDLETVYGATDIFLLTSRNEGTPVALIESLAAGCVGVSTDVGGVADVMPTSDVGLMAPPGDAGQLADHVSRLVAEPGRRRAMGEAGRQRVVAQYGINRLVTDIDGLYRDLLA
ncbi:MAG: glycosyltransferase family 1 protein [Acidobacteria bacterium]|nr:MAG: glycosyltransferase family 1 protein [Acidobacteriota bacterium]